jgi:radical SAM superfamily enzyme YgiQ (UPF0313 family)
VGVLTEERKQQSLERFFPCWDNVNLTRYDYPYQYPLVTGIGCIGRCAFCAPGVGKVRLRPVENVIGELQEARDKFHINRFEVISEIFYPSAKNIIEFCNRLSKSSMNLRWRCNLRADIPIEVFPYMAEAGCQEIILGVESYDNSVLDRMNKFISKETMHTTIEKAHAHGIRVTAGLMAGNVKDTPETLRKTANFIIEKNIMVDRPSFFTPLQVYPGTELYAEAMRKGLIKNEYEHLKNLSRSLYSYLNPSQKRNLLPEAFVNLTDMSDNSFEYSIEINEWNMHQNAFQNWTLQNFNGRAGKCSFCNAIFTVEKSLQTRENAVVCPNCLAYNLITMDQTNYISYSLDEVIDLIKGDAKFAFIGTRESAYWLTSFVKDNDKVQRNWKFFRHPFF